MGHTILFQFFERPSHIMAVLICIPSSNEQGFLFPYQHLLLVKFLFVRDKGLSMSGCSGTWNVDGGNQTEPILIANAITILCMLRWKISIHRYRFCFLSVGIKGCVTATDLTSFDASNSYLGEIVFHSRFNLHFFCGIRISNTLVNVFCVCVEFFCTLRK